MYADLISFKHESIGKNIMFISANIIKADSWMELNKKINSSKEELIIAEGGELNRLILENKRVDIIVGAEKSKKNDFLHYRNSGLNQVLCKLARKNDIAVAFNFNEVLKLKGAGRSQLIGRMMQNVRMCRKYGVRMIIASFATNKFELKNPSDLMSFGMILGMTPKEAKDGLENVSYFLSDKKEKITDGLRIIKK